MARKKLTEGDWNAIGNVSLLGFVVAAQLAIVLYAQLTNPPLPTQRVYAGEQQWLLTMPELKHGCAGGTAHDVRTYSGTLPVISNPALACW